NRPLGAVGLCGNICRTDAASLSAVKMRDIGRPDWLWIRHSLLIGSLWYRAPDCTVSDPGSSAAILPQVAQQSSRSPLVNRRPDDRRVGIPAPFPSIAVIPELHRLETIAQRRRRHVPECNDQGFP